MKHKNLTRVVERIPESRYRRSPEVHERFVGWATLQGLNPVDISTDGTVVIERNGRRWLSVREFVRNAEGRAEVTARTGDRVRIQRRNIPIESLPDWL